MKNNLEQATTTVQDMTEVFEAFSSVATHRPPSEFLSFLEERISEKYGESPNVDFLHYLREYIKVFKLAEDKGLI